MSDTSRAAAEAQARVWRALGPSGRSRVGAELSEATRKITLEGIRRRHPEYDELDAEYALRGMLWGRELFRRVYSVDPPPP